jgi:hypothetical protein
MPAWGDEAQAPAEARSKYVRLERDKSDELVALQTAIVHFVASDPAQRDLTVDLVGAVHVGEKAYYEALNKQFEKYDVVLYELVAPPGTRIPKGAKPGNHPVAMLQNWLKDVLELEHQLQYIDYTKQNMLHADMSPDDFSKSMNDRGESFATMFFRMMGQAMAQQSLQKHHGKAPELDLFAALFDKDRAGALKRLMAEQFENVEGAMEALDGPGGSTIITERNKVALARLAEQIAAGKKKIAIFYGAGHMTDIEKHLVADFQLKRGPEQWLTAWKLEKTPEAPKPQPAKPAASITPQRIPAARLSLAGHLSVTR